MPKIISALFPVSDLTKMPDSTRLSGSLNVLDSVQISDVSSFISGQICEFVKHC